MKIRLVVASIAILVCACAAQADVVLTLERVSQATVDSLKLRINNDDALEIADFTLALGDTSFNFDSAKVTSLSAGLTPTLVSPDAINNGLRSDELRWTFTGFGEDGFLLADVDLDRDTGSQTVDWQTTFFNNGATANALWRITWADGRVNSLLLPDDPGRDPFAPYVVRMGPPQSSAVPEPSSMVLAGLGGIGAITVLRRKKRS